MGLLDLPELGAVRDGRAVVRRGRGEAAAVAALQAALRSMGALLAEDGAFERPTEDAIRAFQRQVGLEADGIVGRQTLHALAQAADAGLRLEGLPLQGAPVPDFRWLDSRDRFGAEVALTFDDGPHPERTARILDILREQAAPATFFVIGRNAAAHPDLVRRAAAEGHAVGNHSWDHADYGELTGAQIADQLARTERALEAALGAPPAPLARAPYGSPFFGAGSAQRRVVEAELARAGHVHALWNVDSNDWRHRGDPEAVISEVERGLRPGVGGVVLLHDVHPQTVAALPGVIDAIRRRGCQIVPLSRLVERKYGVQASGFYSV